METPIHRPQPHEHSNTPSQNCTHSLHTHTHKNTQSHTITHIITHINEVFPSLYLDVAALNEDAVLAEELVLDELRRRVNDAQQVVRVDLHGSGEENHFEQLRDSRQEGVEMGPLARVDEDLLVFHLQRKLDPVVRQLFHTAVHQRLIQVLWFERKRGRKNDMSRKRKREGREKE